MPEFLTTYQVAQLLGVNKVQVSFWKRLGAPMPGKFGKSYLWNTEAIENLKRWREERKALPRAKRKTTADPARTAEWVERFKAGENMHQISLTSGVSRERVRQIISGEGINTKQDGGLALWGRRKQEALAAKREAHCMKSYGCDLATFKALTGMEQPERSGILIHKYWHHKNNAQRQGARWAISLPEYAQLLNGRLHELSVSGLHMARIDARGAFRIDNVRLLTASEHAKQTSGFSAARKRLTMLAEQRRAKAVALYEEEGLTREQIAARLKVSIVTVSAYFLRAKQQADGK